MSKSDLDDDDDDGRGAKTSAKTGRKGGPTTERRPGEMQGGEVQSRRADWGRVGEERERRGTQVLYSRGKRVPIRLWAPTCAKGPTAIALGWA